MWQVLEIMKYIKKNHKISQSQNPKDLASMIESQDLEIIIFLHQLENIIISVNQKGFDYFYLIIFVQFNFY